MESAQERLHALDYSLLTHQPSTQSDAAKMSNYVEDKRKSLQDELMLGLGLITPEKLRQREEAEDGVMKIIDD